MTNNHENKELKNLLNAQEKLMMEICNRSIAMERVLVIVAKRSERLYDGWLYFRRDLRGWLTELRALVNSVVKRK